MKMSRGPSPITHRLAKCGRMILLNARMMDSAFKHNPCATRFEALKAFGFVNASCECNVVLRVCAFLKMIKSRHSMLSQLN